MIKKSGKVVILTTPGSLVSSTTKHYYLMTSTDKVTRVEVIDHDGRSYTNFNPYHKVKLSFQDDGRTLKIFISTRKKMTEKAQKLVNAFDERYENLGPFDGDWQELCIAQTLRELIKQCSYNHFNLDGDHGIKVINVKDIEEIIEELEP